MAILKSDDRQVEIIDGSCIHEAAEELDVPFGCRNGQCGACKVEILEGMDNLNEMNEAEKRLCPEGNTRLCCQAQIRTGEVKILV